MSSLTTRSEGPEMQPVNGRQKSGTTLQRLSSALMRHSVYPLWLRYDHPGYPAFLRQIMESQYWSRTEIERLQLKRLNRLLAHAYSNCPFYRDRLQRAGLEPGQVDLNAFSRLPVLTKREIQDHGPEMSAANFSGKMRVRNQTGGSTGSPLQFWVDRERLDSRLASTARHDRWTGLRPGDWRAELWGARLDQVIKPGWRDWLRNNLLYRMVEMNTSRIRPEDWVQFIARLRQERPRFMVTYAHSAVLFAQYLREHGIGDIGFDSIITTAEVLLPEQRKIIEETFRATVFDRYGCREMSVIASECEYHRGLHVNAEALLVEVVPDAQFPAPLGKLVVTDLLNYSMPLIRYEIGDVGSWEEGPDCPCGRGLPRLREIHGRTTDFLVLPDGRQISGPALTLVVSDMPDVRQVQFLQKAPDWVVLRVVPGRGFGPQTAAELRRRFRLYLDESTRLDLEEVENIASERSGKYRFVINDLPISPVRTPNAGEPHCVNH